MSSAPRVSLVIPCYNSLRYLPETMGTVLAQTLTDLEVVVVDDGGTDDLAAWVAALEDSRVRVVRQGNAGVSAARNRGIDEARAPYVAFCDSDDLLAPAALERLADALDARPAAGLSYGWYDVIDGEGRPTGRVIAGDWEGRVWDRLVTRNPISASAVMVRASVLAEVGGFEVNRDRFPIDVEDWELWIRIAAGHELAVVPEVLAHHRRHDTNSSSNVESLAAAYDHLLATVFDGASAERAQRRPHARAWADIVLAWQYLNDRQDAASARRYWRRAAAGCPEVRRSAEYWRLGASVTALDRLGVGGYERVRSSARSLRRVASRAQRGAGS